MPKDTKIADGLLGDKQIQFIEGVVGKLTDHISSAAKTLVDHNLLNEDTAEQVLIEILILSYAPFFADHGTFDAFMDVVKEQYEIKLKIIEEANESQNTDTE